MIEFSIVRDGSLGFSKNGCMVARIRGQAYDEYIGVPDLRSSNCALCGSGWRLTGQSFKDHVVVPDMGYAHSACWGRHRTVSELAEWKNALHRSSLVPISTKIIANEYAPYPSSPMWFEFELQTPAGMKADGSTNPKLRVGSRKRVQQIVMTNARISKTAFSNSPIAHAMVTSEWVSPNYVLAHSYSAEQSVIFLRSLNNMAGTAND